MENIKSKGKSEKTCADAFKDQKVESIIHTQKIFNQYLNINVINIWIYNNFILAININIEF